jgi:hypothetical protein
VTRPFGVGRDHCVANASQRDAKNLTTLIRPALCNSRRLTEKD